TKSEQDEHLELLKGQILDNFSMACRVTEYVMRLQQGGVPLPAMDIRFVGPMPAAVLGTNCGMFVIPVVKMALIDVRRSLQFFGLNFNGNGLVPVNHRRPDDLGIEHFGLPRVTPTQFVSVTSRIVRRPVEPTLAEVHKWSNKELAHFTLAKPYLNYPSIRDA